LSVWHHDLLRADGSPYSAAEAGLIRALGGTELTAASDLQAHTPAEVYCGGLF